MTDFTAIDRYIEDHLNDSIEELKVVRPAQRLRSRFGD